MDCKYCMAMNKATIEVYHEASSTMSIKCTECSTIKEQLIHFNKIKNNAIFKIKELRHLLEDEK